MRLATLGSSLSILDQTPFFMMILAFNAVYPLFPIFTIVAAKQNNIVFAIYCARAPKVGYCICRNDTLKVEPRRHLLKVLLRADAHNHPHSRSAKRMEECLTAYDWSYNVARENGIDIVLDLGDVFHDRTHVDAYTFTRVYQSSSTAKKDGISTYFLLGNHDMYFRHDRKASSIIAFEALGSVIYEPKTIDIGDFPCDFFPYAEETPGPEIAEAFPRSKRNNVLFFHASIEGAVMNSASGKKRDIEMSDEIEMHEDEIKECISPKFMDGWKLAVGGHYHMCQVVSESPCKVMYAGSPIQHSFGEAGEEKGLWILDLETLEMERIINDFSPRFMNLDLADADDIGDVDVENCRLRITLKDPSAKLINKLRNQALKSGAISFQYKPIKKERIDRGLHNASISSAAAAVSDGRTMVNRWTNLHPQDDLRREKLREVGYAILEAASPHAIDDDIDGKN
jgi:DNA repair exonuclease SbcCD nuclease subunit